MIISESKFQGLFQDKPECVINLPEWLLPSDKVKDFCSMPNFAIVEVAGRDSIAAAINYLEDNDITDLLPTYVYTGTEYGPWGTVKVAVERLSLRLPNVKVHDLVVLGSPKFFQALNGRFIDELNSRFEFYTPCVGCHLYLHSVRIPLAISLGNVPVIAGERELHDGRTKINQTPENLNLYQSFFNEFNIQLQLPIRKIAEGRAVKELLGFEWKEGEEQLGCVLSGNYRKIDGKMNIQREQISKYLREFAIPCTKKIVKAYIEGNIPDHIAIAREVLEKKG